MSQTLIKQWPAIKLTASEKNKSKRIKMIDAFCDKEFTKAICECWNLVNERASLTPSQKQKLLIHKE